MEKVDVSPDFPCGVKTTYRKYASNEVYEIIKDDSTQVGLTERKVLVNSYPKAKPAENGRPARPAGNATIHN